MFAHSISSRFVLTKFTSHNILAYMNAARFWGGADDIHLTFTTTFARKFAHKSFSMKTSFRIMCVLRFLLLPFSAIEFWVVYNSQSAHFNNQPALYICAIKYHMVFGCGATCHTAIPSYLIEKCWTCICGYVEPQAGLEFGLMFWCGVINVWFSFNFQFTIFRWWRSFRCAWNVCWIFLFQCYFT